jgi:hypothetical protein
MDKKRFLFVSLSGLIGDIAWQMVKEGHEVRYWIGAADERDIADGFVPKTDDWEGHVDWADVLVFDDTLGQGARAEALRRQGKAVVGGTEYTDRLEGDRSFGQEELKKAGVNIIPYRELIDFDEAIEFVRQNPTRYVIKPSGEAQNGKRRLFVGEEDDGADVVNVLEAYKRAVAAQIPVFQLQRRMAGVEVAVGAERAPASVEQSGDGAPREGDRFRMHRMREAGRAPRRDLRAHRAQRGRRLFDATPRHVRVGIAGREVDRRAGEIARGREVGAGWADAAAGGGDQGAVAPRLACHELARQAGPLREAEEHDPLRRNAGRFDLGDERADARERRVEPRLVRLERRQEALRIPAAVARLRRDERHRAQVELAGEEVGDPLRRRAAAVQGDDGGARGGERRPRRDERLAVVQPHTRSASAGSRRGSTPSISARCPSSQGGSTSASPRCSGASSTAKPGPSVASSKSTPPGSLK